MLGRSVCAKDGSYCVTLGGHGVGGRRLSRMVVVGTDCVILGRSHGVHCLLRLAERHAVLAGAGERASGDQDVVLGGCVGEVERPVVVSLELLRGWAGHHRVGQKHAIFVVRIFVRDIVPDDLGGHKPVFCINTTESLWQRKGRRYPVVARVAIPVDAQEESRQILKLIVVEERVAAWGWWVFEVVEGGVEVVVQRRAQVNCEEVSAQQFWQSRRYQVSRVLHVRHTSKV